MEDNYLKKIFDQDYEEDDEEKYPEISRDFDYEDDDLELLDEDY
ncbi:hypothetical protein [Miniphocaeibacter halophilus]|nr:hypothetical protein [Miniphocaeibacter halophilus]